MSKESIETIPNIETSHDLIFALEKLARAQNIQYVYINGDGPFTLSAELIEETLSDGSKVTDIYLSTPSMTSVKL